MSIETTEKRVNPRAQYFLVRKSDDYIPIFAFRSESDPTAIAAVVTDMSEGGIQILSAISTELDSERYALTLISGPQKEEKSLHTCEVSKVWSRPEGMHIQSGFSFASSSHPISELVTQMNTSEHQLLRCILHPLG
jgi:hypothetical protein